MSPAKAADIFEKLKARVSAESAELEAAENVLKAWASEHPEASDFEGRIRIKRSSRKQLNQGAVRAHLGDQVEGFMRATPTVGLELIHLAVRELSAPEGEALHEVSCTGCQAQVMASIDLRPALTAQGWDLHGRPRCPACR
jgi:hypothetical protein